MSNDGTRTEERLRGALDAWAATVQPSPDAWAEQERRRRGRRWVRAGALVAAAAAVAGIVAGVLTTVGSPGGHKATPASTGHWASPKWSPNFPTPTSPWTVAGSYGAAAAPRQLVAYWHDNQLCDTVFDRDGRQDGYVGCSRLPYSAGSPVVAAGFGDQDGRLYTAVLTRSDVTRVEAVLSGGGRQGAATAGAAGYSTRIAAFPGLDVTRVRRWVAYDDTGAVLTDPTPALEFRRPTRVWDDSCARHRAPAGTVLAPDLTGGRCYALRAPDLTVRRFVAVDAVEDPTTRSWLVQLQLTAPDRRAFGDLTTELARWLNRTVPEGGVSRATIALVAGGTVLSAPVIQEPILGGMAQVSGSGIDERYAYALAAILRR